MKIIHKNNFHTHKNKAYTYQQISIRTKIKSSFIQQYHKLHTMQSFINHKHCPNLTISNNSTIQKCPKKKKKSTWPHNDFPSNYTMSKIPTKANNSNMTMPHHKFLNKIWNQQIYQQKAKYGLTLKSFLDECGVWLLGSWRSPSWMSVEYGVWFLGVWLLGWVWSIVLSRLQNSKLNRI